MVTVLVAARNEAGTINLCLEALLQQAYPEHRYQIIVIDDHSVDQTAAAVEQNAHPNLACLRLPAGLSGKKAALEFGASVATGEIILTTDADCQPPPQWIALHVGHLQRGKLQASAGPVVLTGKDSALYRFQALDLCGMMVLTAVGLHTKAWILGNGASLAYLRAAFESVEGYAGNRSMASGDDIFLLAKFNKQSSGRVQFLKTGLAAVPTPAAITWGAFFQQRLRWGTKNAAAPASAGTFFALGFVFLFSWAVLLTPFLGFWIGSWGLASFLLLLGFKSWADYRLLRTASSFFGQRHLLKSFAVSEGIHILYIAMIGLASLAVRKYHWKGRPLR